MTGPLFGLIVDSCHVNLLLEKTHFLVPTVVQVKQGQGHVGFNQHRTPDPVYVMSGGSTRNSVRSGAFYQDVKSSAPLSSFPLTVYPGGKGPDHERYHPSYCVGSKRIQRYSENQLTNEKNNTWGDSHANSFIMLLQVEIPTRYSSGSLLIVSRSCSYNHNIPSYSL